MYIAQEEVVVTFSLPLPLPPSPFPPPPQFVRRQVSMLKQGVASLEGMLPAIEKKMSGLHSDLQQVLLDFAGLK